MGRFFWTFPWWTFLSSSKLWLNIDMYLDFLQNDICPVLIIIIEPLIHWIETGIPTVGVTTDYSPNVCNYLNEMFPGRWVGRRGAFDWSDLIHLDFIGSYGNVENKKAMYRKSKAFFIKLSLFTLFPIWKFLEMPPQLMTVACTFYALIFSW